MRTVPGQQKVRNGVVVSDKMDKTVVVLVERLVQHVQYKKYVKQRKKYKAHDPENRCKTGDVVTIVETRPLSREKRWLVREVVKQAAVE
ncbi:MAG: 30S ribosomal protein S17 [Deltaproteobacteria bacterium]|nr:30S ribosomal protein S17 [Deltaproteobacteria bacterium]NOT57005.1 30S ribosomal protein S17 [Deltaproteobacteria bacterium]